jgi:SpoVK/Ycf46/Vps4 family AAA+-type ATPase
VVRRPRVLDGWGFARKLSGGTGTNALFTGPPGTGKTLAAEVVSHALGLKLYRIDLATIVSKYIGETEKNLARVFQSAERSNAVLLFDEADALFGKRSVVRDAHDRYANIEISYLLQRMEQYEGVAILATNLAQNMDEAFVRRLAFTVSFPFPGEELRRPLWMRAWPGETPVSADLDPAWLARRFKLSGGSIKNVALAAAHLVGDDETEVTLDHVLRAVRREFQKMGKERRTLAAPAARSATSSAGHDGGDDLAPVATVDPEVAVQRDHQAPRLPLGHPNDTSVGQRHGDVGEPLHERAHRADFRSEIELDPDDVSDQQLEHGVLTAESPQQEAGLGENGFASEDRRHDGVEEIAHPLVMSVAAVQERDQRARIDDGPIHLP